MSDCTGIMEQIQAEVDDATANVEQAVDGKKVAIARGRKNLQNIKNLAQELRIALQELKKK